VNPNIQIKYSSKLSNGHSPQIRVTRSLLVRMYRGESHFFQKWVLANVGESGESEQNRLANVGESGESQQNRLANVGESGESGTFPKKAILASTRIR